MDISRKPDFVRTLGPAYLAHILRRLSDRLIAGAADAYPELGVVTPPRATSTLLLLDKLGPLPVTEIADRLRQSHPLVISWIAALIDLDLVRKGRDPHDGRRSLVQLTRAGNVEVARLKTVLIIIDVRSSELMADAKAEGLMDALWRLDDALDHETAACRFRR